VRVVSLLPSATESLCAIGGGSLLVGRSHECDFGALGDGLSAGQLASLPVLTGQRTGPHEGAGSSRRIDVDVRTALATSGSLYTLDTELLADLKPDVILTQDVCEVCSIDVGTVREAAREISRRRNHDGSPPTVISLNPAGVEDVLDDLFTIGRAVGLQKNAAEVVGRLRERMFRAAEHVNAYVEGPVVGFMEWTDPVFVAGHWTVQLIERAGGRHPLNPTTIDEEMGVGAGMQWGMRTAGKSVRVPAEVFAATRPEWLVICPCGYGLEQARAATDELMGQAWFRSLPAVRSGRVAIVDGSQHFNRPGPRLIEAFEWLVGWLNDRAGLMPRGFPWAAVGALR